MTFDALTIAGIVTAVLSGGFVLALAMAEAPSPAAHRRPVAGTPCRGRAWHGAGRPCSSGAPRAGRRQAKQFRPRTAVTITA